MVLRVMGERVLGERVTGERAEGGGQRADGRELRARPRSPVSVAEWQSAREGKGHSKRLDDILEAFELRDLDDSGPDGRLEAPA